MQVWSKKVTRVQPWDVGGREISETGTQLSATYLGERIPKESCFVMFENRHLFHDSVEDFRCQTGKGKGRERGESGRRTGREGGRDRSLSKIPWSAPVAPPCFEIVQNNPWRPTFNNRRPKECTECRQFKNHLANNSRKQIDGFYGCRWTDGSWGSAVELRLRFCVETTFTLRVKVAFFVSAIKIREIFTYSNCCIRFLAHLQRKTNNNAARWLCWWRPARVFVIYFCNFWATRGFPGYQK